MDANVTEALKKGHVIDITTHGNKSGEDRRIEIVFHAFDGKVYLSGLPRPAKRKWLRNLEADPDFTFHLKQAVKADLPAHARVITAEPERRALLTQVKATQDSWKHIDLEDAVKMSPLVEVTFKG